MGELDIDEESVGFTLAEESKPAAAPISEFVAGTLERLRAPASAPQESPVARLRAALAGADRDRLRADAARLAPLVRRLAALRERGTSPR